MRRDRLRRCAGALLAVLFVCTAAPAGAAVKQVARGTAAAPAAHTAPQTAAAAVIRWQPYPGAVRYAVRILRVQGGETTVLAEMNRVYTTGLHLPQGAYTPLESAVWSVQPLDYHGAPLDAWSAPQPVPVGLHEPDAPVLTAQFDEMAYAPLYPVYSWIPRAGDRQHEVAVYRRTGGDDVYLHTLEAGEYDVYDDMPFTTPGQYVYRVRSVTAEGRPHSDWSAEGTFRVVAPTPVAALGDSITHGGGAITLPPSYLLYDWESYCTVPVKNLGHSGDTTADMLARFERDVPPFAPRVLIIMGGVNDYRSGIYGAESVRNLTALREKCRAHDIIPVFLTAPPIRPALMAARMDIMAPPADWWEHRDYINSWIMQQAYSIDIATVLSDANGELEAAYTTDGLHPDLMGKKYIGETVDAYLRAHFAYAAGEAARRAYRARHTGE